MGTRGAICFVADGEEKIVYNHFDSYPDGLGEDIATWLREGVHTEAELKALVLRLEAVPNGSEPTPEQRELLKQYWDKTVSTGEDWYSLLRHTQGDPAAILEARYFEDASDFPLDSLFCEWCYVIDFDQRVFEVYQGFRHSPPTEGRWVGAESQGRTTPGGNYYPVQRIKSYSFDELPEKGVVTRLQGSEG